MLKKTRSVAIFKSDTCDISMMIDYSKFTYGKIRIHNTYDDGSLSRLNIPAGERSKFVHAVFTACDLKISSAVTDESFLHQCLVLFSHMDDKAYETIRKFLIENNIMFTGEHWNP